MAAEIVRRTLAVRGLVQGVGFRPFVYRLATELSLGGWVRNDAGGVTVSVEGPAATVEEFQVRLCREHPPLARVEECRVKASEPIPTWSVRFEIGHSSAEGAGALVTPDSYVCDDCLRELFDPSDRRFGYPFINCTNCGPRFTIIGSVPYDRPATTMADFEMCRRCRAEYDDPLDRRFHAQPNACWDCGPLLRLADPDGAGPDGAGPDGAGADGDTALATAAARLRAGDVLALKALGGYQLCVDAANGAAVARLRRHKDRDAKPFALLAASVEAVRRHAFLSAAEERLLTSPGRPIVLLRRRPESPLSTEIAPNLASLGFMLPSTPVQHLLLAEGFDVVVATSGNAKDAPMAADDAEAFETLAATAEVFLTHNRRIHVRADDSVARVVGGEPSFVRRGRGYSPDVLPLPVRVRPVIALGPELKATVCVARGDRGYLGPHIGDLKSPGNQAFHREIAAHLLDLFGVVPEVVAHDLHPNFHSSAVARRYPGVDRVAVQHHHAHLASCMVDNGLVGPVIGVIFDGTGYGTDGTIWGGEFLVGDYDGVSRFGHLETFRLPGGDAAVREPWRIAAGLLSQHHPEAFADRHIEVTPFQREVLARMVATGTNSPLTSSMGRFFDVVSSLLGVCTTVSYEGQAAIELEQLIAYDHRPAKPWPVEIATLARTRVLSYRPWLAGLLADLAAGLERPAISRRFHESVVHGVVAMCRRARAEHRIDDVVLSGGVFLNQHLTVRCRAELGRLGFTVHTHHGIPTNDAGISVGQAVVAGRARTGGSGP